MVAEGTTKFGAGSTPPKVVLPATAFPALRDAFARDFLDGVGKGFTENFFFDDFSDATNFTAVNNRSTTTDDGTETATEFGTIGGEILSAGSPNNSSPKSVINRARRPWGIKLSARATNCGSDRGVAIVEGQNSTPSVPTAPCLAISTTGGGALAPSDTMSAKVVRDILEPTPIINPIRRR
jgi:hypothetical protein